MSGFSMQPPSMKDMTGLMAAFADSQPPEEVLTRRVRLKKKQRPRTTRLHKKATNRNRNKMAKLARRRNRK